VRIHTCPSIRSPFRSQASAQLSQHGCDFHSVDANKFARLGAVGDVHLLYLETAETFASLGIRSEEQTQVKQPKKRGKKSERTIRD
jgi:hypothetical protein